MLKTQGLYRPFRIWQPIERPDWPAIASFVRLGLPAGLAYLVEITSFTLMALFIARLGTTALASHQIAASMAAVLYMMPLSIAIACSARTSFWLGAGKPDHARHVVLLGFKLVAVISCALAATLFIAKENLAALYSTSPGIIAMASTLLGWVALYHLADGVQAVCAFLLRCYRITIAPLVVYSVLLWGAGLYGGYVLTYHGVEGVAGFALNQPASQTPVSFWLAGTLALMCVAGCFMALLWRAVRASQSGSRRRFEP